MSLEDSSFTVNLPSHLGFCLARANDLLETFFSAAITLVPCLSSGSQFAESDFTEPFVWVHLQSGTGCLGVWAARVNTWIYFSFVVVQFFRWAAATVSVLLIKVLLNRISFHLLSPRGSFTHSLHVALHILAFSIRKGLFLSGALPSSSSLSLDYYLLVLLL